MLQGFRKDEDFDQARQILDSFLQEPMVNPSLALQSARNYRMLRHKGIPVRKTIDSFIATFCIEYKHDLLHMDRDFDGYETHLGLKVVHP